MTVRFKYSHLLRTALIRPKGYLEEVLKNSVRHGQDVCMGMDVYQHLCSKYSNQVVSHSEFVRTPLDGCCGKSISTT